MSIAGVSVRSLILDTNINDIDIFIYGIENPTDANVKIEKFLLQIKDNISKLKNGHYVHEELEKQKLSKKENNSKILKDRTQYDPYIDETIAALYNGYNITICVGNLIIQINTEIILKY